MRRMLVFCALMLAAAATPLFAVDAAPPTDVPELSTVLSLFSAHASPEAVRLNWTLDHQSPTILRFRIYRGYEEVGKFAVLTEVNVRPTRDSVEYSFADTLVRDGVSYYYKIAAVGQKNESVFPVVITATPPFPGQVASTSRRELAPAAILPGEKITLYVRRAGHVKLTMLLDSPHDLVDDTLQPGIYEFDAPAKSLSLELEHEKGRKMEVAWPVP